MVTKKRRRRQLARASAERQQVRRAQRAAQRRRRNIAIGVVAAVLAVAALVYWIVTHPADASANAQGTAAPGQLVAAPAPSSNTSSIPLGAW